MKSDTPLSLRREWNLDFSYKEIQEKYPNWKLFDQVKGKWPSEANRAHAWLRNDALQRLPHCYLVEEWPVEVGYSSRSVRVRGMSTIYNMKGEIFGAIRAWRFPHVCEWEPYLQDLTQIKWRPTTKGFSFRKVECRALRDGLNRMSRALASGKISLAEPVATVRSTRAKFIVFGFWASAKGVVYGRVAKYKAEKNGIKPTRQAISFPLEEFHIYQDRFLDLFDLLNQ